MILTLCLLVNIKGVKAGISFGDGIGLKCQLPRNKIVGA